MLTEEQLIHLCRKGKPEGQRLLYARYGPVLKAICIRYLKDRELASDILHDVFIKIFGNIKKYKGDGSFSGWMKRIAVNACMDYHRKHSGIWKNYDDYSVLDSIEYKSDAEDVSIVNQILDAGLTKEHILEFLHHIPENYSSVFNMFYIDGISHKEIARFLDISEALSRKWAFRAKELIRNEIIKSLENKLNNVL